MILFSYDTFLQVEGDDGHLEGFADTACSHRRANSSPSKAAGSKQCTDLERTSDTARE